MPALLEGKLVQQYDEDGDPVIPGVTRTEHSWDAPPILKGWEAVRMRPGMYIGDVGVRGLHYLFKEIMDNSVNEVLAGHCTEIDVFLNDDHSITVSDNGRGIPVRIISESGKSAIEHVFTEPSFRHRTHIHGDDCPKVSGGLHAVGAEVVNALSEWLECLVKRDGKTYRIRFERGELVTALEMISDCELGEHGTKVTWLADKTIFTPALSKSGGLAYDREIITRRCRELTYHIPRARIRFHDRLHNKPSETFHSPSGVVDLCAISTADETYSPRSR
jgi:DNA gyrase subunit B